MALEDRARRGMVLRAIDKIDRLGAQGVAALLGEGRKDESGDFTKGAGLSAEQAARILAFVAPDAQDEDAHLRQIGTLVGSSAVGAAGLSELEQIVKLLSACGYGPDRMQFDTGVVRGLDYYTGAVFEAQLTFPVQNEAGETVVFGSVAGGGRYDDLVARFTGQTRARDRHLHRRQPADLGAGVARAFGRRSCAAGGGDGDGQGRSRRQLPDGGGIARRGPARRSLCRHRQDSAIRSNMPTSAAPPSP